MQFTLSEEANLFVAMGGVATVWDDGVSSGSYQPCAGKITFPNGLVIALIGGRDNGIHTGYHAHLRVKHLTRATRGWEPVNSYRLLKHRASGAFYVVWGFSASTALGSIKRIDQLYGVRGGKEYCKFDEYSFPPHSRMIVLWQEESPRDTFIEGRIHLQNSCECFEETSCPELW